MLNNILENDDLNQDVSSTLDESTTDSGTSPNPDDPEKNSVVQYRFGAKKLNLQTYIYNLDDNVKRYLNSKNWSPEKKQEFINQYHVFINTLKEQLTAGNKESQIYTDQFGTIFDPSGTITNDTDEFYYNDKNKQISKDQYDQLKTRKQKKYSQFNASEEVARYFYKIGEQINPIGTAPKKEKKKFNTRTMGFASWWQQQNNRSGGETNMGPYINKDSWDSTLKTRPTTQRTNYFNQQLREYLKHIDVYKDYDWTDSGFKSFEDYKQQLENLQKHLGSDWDESDEIRANLAGIDSNFYTMLFTREQYPHLSTEEKAALIAQEKAAKEAEDANSAEQDRLNFINKVADDFYNKGFMYTKIAATDGRSKENTISIKDSKTIEGLDDYNVLGVNYDRCYAKYGFSDGTTALKAVIDRLVNDDETLKDDKDALTAFDLAIRQLEASPEGIQDQTYTNVDGHTCIVFGIKDEDYSVVIYDMNTRELYVGSMLELQGMTDRMYQDYLYKQKKLSPSTIYGRKKGGIINRAQFGVKIRNYNDFQNLSDVFEKKYEDEVRATAEMKGISYEEEKAGRRRVGTWYADAEATDAEPNAGFTANDRRRLISIGLEAGSMITAFIPGANVVSTATGVGSSLTNFIADVVEDGFQAKDAWNLATNVGMDFLGMIPVAGGGVKGAKLVKSIAKYAPRIMTAIGAASTLMNGTQIIASFDKLLKKPSELTVNDWRNITTGLNFVTGMGAAGLRKKSQVAIKEKNRHPDNNAVAVEMKNSSGKKQILLFEGKDARAIKQADGNPAEIKKITSKYKAYEDWDVATETNHSLWRGFKDNEGYHLNPFKSRVTQGPAKVYDNIYGQFDIFGRPHNNGKFYVEMEDGRWYASNDKAKVDQVAVSNKELAESDAFADMMSEMNKAKQRKVKKEKELKDLRKKYERSTRKNNKNNQITNKKIEDVEMIVVDADGNVSHEWEVSLNPESKKSKQLRNKIESIEEWLDDFNYSDYNRARSEFFDKYVKKRRGKYSVEIPVHNSEPIREDLNEIFSRYGLFKKGGHIVKAQNGTYVGFGDEKTDKDVKKIKNWGIIKEILDNPTLLYGVPRAIKGVMDNNKIIDIKKKSNKPVYKTPVELNTKFEEPTLNIEEEGRKKSAMLKQQVSNNLMTSDADKNTAINYEAIVKGIDYEDAKKAEANDVAAKARQFYNSQVQVNNAARQKAADYNRLVNNQIEVANSDLEIARIKGNNDIGSKLSEQLEELALGEREINKQETKARLNKNIENALKTNLEGVARHFGISVPEDQLNIWNKYKSGKVAYSKLTSEEKDALGRVMFTVEILGNKMYDRATGKYPTMWADQVFFMNENMFKIDQNPPGSSGETEE